MGAEVHKVTWQQVGSVAEPGRYLFKFGWLTIEAKDLAIWKRFPTAAFTLMPLARTSASEDGVEEFHLGLFEV